MRYVAVQVGLFLGLAAAAFVRVQSVGVPRWTWATGVGGVLCLASLGIAVLAFRALGRSFQVQPAPRQDAVMVTRGIYRRLRHPMYTSASLFAIGTAFCLPGRGVIALAAAITLFFLVKARHEERLLQARYPEYKAYARNTWGVWPFL